MSRDAATPDVLNEITKRLTQNDQPLQIILYGSYAWGTPDEDSDIDLFLLVDEGGSRLDRWRQVRNALDGMEPPITIQPLILTKDELRRRLEVGDHFIEDILRHGKILWGTAVDIRPARTKETPIRYARQWLAEAEIDLHDAAALLEIGGKRSAFLLQQAVEKFLKAFLIANGWRLHRTHDLMGLLDTAVVFDPAFEAHRSVREEIDGFFLGGWYPVERDVDPLKGRPITMDWVRSCFNGAAPLIAAIRAAVGSDSDEME